MVGRRRATIMVLQEEHHPKRSNSSSGGGRSRPKKPKPNRVPQRGLGVAQLERIRLEEQQKNATAAASSSSIPNFPPTQQATLPFLPPADPNPLIKPPILIASAGTELLGPAVPHASEGSSMGSARISCGHGLMPMLWNSFQPTSHEAEALSRKSGLHGCLPSDARSLSWRCCSLTQRRQQQLISLMNKTQTPSSSGANLQMEPPSNQNYCSNYAMASSWSEEERVVGMKRPCPFQLDTASSHSSFHCKMPPFHSSTLKPDESLTMYGNDIIKFESRNTSRAFREGASGTTWFHVDWKSSDLHLGKGIEENGSATDGCFLTLGPPITPSISKCKQSMVIPQSHHHKDSELNFLPNHAFVDDTMSQNGGLGHPPFYSFLPTGPSTREVTISDRRGEALDGLDLNLKL